MNQNSTSTPELTDEIAPKERTEILRYSISRYDSYFQGVNSKIALYVTLNTFILTAVSAGSRQLIAQFHSNSNIAVLFLTLTTVASAVSILFTIRASIPYLKSAQESIFFFGYVSSLSYKDFKDKVDNINYDEAIRDLTCQAHSLAAGLKTKYYQLQIAGYLLLADFVFIITLALLIITNTSK